MEILRAYLKTLSPAAQADYAKRAGTTIGYIKKVLYTGQQVGGRIARRLDEESAGAVPRAELRPDIFGENPNA